MSIEEDGWSGLFHEYVNVIQRQNILFCIIISDAFITIYYLVMISLLAFLKHPYLQSQTPYIALFCCKRLHATILD